VEGQKQTLGASHANTLDTVATLASELEAQGKLPIPRPAPEQLQEPPSKRPVADAWQQLSSTAREPTPAASRSCPSTHQPAQPAQGVRRRGWQHQVRC
jgi:hypothetical protein